MSEMSGMDKYKFRRALEHVEEAVGRGTELVSVYVPPGRPISDCDNSPRREFVTSEIGRPGRAETLASSVPPPTAFSAGLGGRPDFYLFIPGISPLVRTTPLF